MSEHNVGIDRLQLFEYGLNFRPDEGQKSITEFFYDWAFKVGPLREQPGPSPCFGGAYAARTEYDPMKHAPWVLCGKPENRSSATDLDIVRVRTEAKYSQRTTGFRIQFKLNHSGLSF